MKAHTITGVGSSSTVPDNEGATDAEAYLDEERVRFRKSSSHRPLRCYWHRFDEKEPQCSACGN